MDIKPAKIRHLKQLLPVEQKWLAAAVTRIIKSEKNRPMEDRQLFEALGQVFTHEQSRRTIEGIASLLSGEKTPRLNEIRASNIEKLIYMINTMVLAVLIDESCQEESIRSYFNAGVKLGVSYDLLMSKLYLQKEKIRIANAQFDVDKRLRSLPIRRIRGEKKSLKAV